MFSDEFLKDLGAWQSGWAENQTKRLELAVNLQTSSEGIPNEFKKVQDTCYRKRFLLKGELFEIIMVDEKEEGIVSWTTKKEYAEMFKGLCAPNSVSAAIFEHKPTDKEVIVNICSLWRSSDFVSAVELYKDKGGENVEALLNFKDSQGEVVLNSSLKGSEIIALVGVSSPFDDLCDQIGLPEDKRDHYFIELDNAGMCPGQLKYTSKEGTQRVIQNVIGKMDKKIKSVMEK